MVTKLMVAVYIPVPLPLTELEIFIQQPAPLYELDLLTCSPKSDSSLPVESVTPGTVMPGTCMPIEGFSQPTGMARGRRGMQCALQLYKQICLCIEAILPRAMKSDPHGGGPSSSAA